MTYTEEPRRMMLRSPEVQTPHLDEEELCRNCVVLDEHPTLPYVYSFAALMEHKFHLNRHKGNRDGWMAMEPRSIYHNLEDENIELECALVAWEADPSVENARAVALECADVANFCLELADRVGGLP